MRATFESIAINGRWHHARNMNEHVEAHIDFIEFPATNAAQLGRAKTFFAGVFGWTFQDYGDDYADITNAGVGGGINADAAHRPRAPLPVVYTRDLEAVRDRVLAQGGEITRAIFSFPGGRRFHFVDPCGNEMAVWSDAK